MAKRFGHVFLSDHGDRFRRATRGLTIRECRPLRCFLIFRGYSLLAVGALKGISLVIDSHLRETGRKCPHTLSPLANVLRLISNMPLPLEKFVQQLQDSGILAGDTIQDFIPPNATPKDSEDLARELVRKKKLTKFQAEEVYKGKAKSLVLGNYVLMEQIGAGGMGQVFKAHHRRMDRFVAVKLLPPTMTKDKAAIARFEREVKAAAKISHPNIVAAHDADCANGVHFLVMELVEGNDLSALVKKKGQLPVAEALNYILQAAKGLEAAHKKGIVHRDIKPANLLLDTEGTVKILDLGLARLNGDRDGPVQADLTSTGTIMGTVDYMAPEQALDTKTADARADVYALGCSLFYLLTGKATYEGDTVMKKLLAHREQPIPSLRADRPDVPELIESAFRKMVMKKVDDRFQTMSEVIAELERCSPRHEQSFNKPHSLSPLPDTELIDYRTAIFVEPTNPVSTKQFVRPPIGNGQNKWLLIGGGMLGVLILLAGLMVTLKTKEGTVIVTVNEPEADVQVLNEEGKVEVTRKGEQGPITITVDPGKHRLKVTKDGFDLYAKEFEVESGGKKLISAKLVPAVEKPAMVGTKPAPVAIGTKKPLAYLTPGFDQWVKEVAAMLPAKQVEAVSKKLVELNPEFDGKVTHTIANDAVVLLNFISDHVTDLSPVRALRDLQTLYCRGSGVGKSQLADLSPLQGLPLQSLEIGMTGVVDLSQLSGLPLNYLSCGYTAIADLTPLKEMPLSELYFSITQVSDLTPLQGMALTVLDCNGTQVSDLSPLRGMKLTNLYCGDTAITDLSPLEGMPLSLLNCINVQASDLTPLRGMPLTWLNCGGMPVKDLSPLRGMKIWLLYAPGTQISDLSPLAGMPLEVVSLEHTQVSDLSPLKGAPLRVLQCHNTLVDDLSPLAGRPLTCLTCSNTKVTTLSILKGMPLESLWCDGNKIPDLSLLKDLPLKELRLDFQPARDTELLKSIKTLEAINGKPAAEFWKEVEGKKAQMSE